MTPTDIGAALSNSLSVSSLLILTAIGLAITAVILRITWQSWRTVRGHDHHH